MPIKTLLKLLLMKVNLYLQENQESPAIGTIFK